MTYIIKTEDLSDYKSQKNRSKLCVCKAASPCLYFLRFFGFFPLIWEHEDDLCTYKKSFLWLIYSGLLLCFQIWLVSVNVNYSTILQSGSILVSMDILTNCIYTHYVILTQIIILLKNKAHIETLNTFIRTLKVGILCESALRKLVILQYAMIISVIGIVLINIGFYIYIVYWLELFDRISIVYRILPNYAFFLYCMLFTSLGLYISTLACFEKLTLNTLNYVPVHPLKDLDETNNGTDFMGIFSYKLCDEKHLCPQEILKLNTAEKVEYLRIYHENISLCIYSFNSCMNPHFLLHTLVELSILVLNWYAVVIYVVYNFKGTKVFYINILNWMYCISHSYGVFLFLRNTQHLKNMIHGLVTFLLEFSTRVTNPEEHQQTRLFIEKINHHRPFTASGVFDVDLGIAGPICAQILTYVLVALQFEISKE